MDGTLKLGFGIALILVGTGMFLHCLYQSFSVMERFEAFYGMGATLLYFGVGCKIADFGPEFVSAHLVDIGLPLFISSGILTRFDPRGPNDDAIENLTYVRRLRMALVVTLGMCYVLGNDLSCILMYTVGAVYGFLVLASWRRFLFEKAAQQVVMHVEGSEE